MTPTIEEKNKMIPLCLAALHKKHKMANFLYDEMNKDQHSWTEHRNEVFSKCIEANMFDVAIRILKDNEDFPQDKHEWDVLRVVAQNPGVFTSQTIISKIKSYLVFTGLVTGDGIQLLRLLLKRVAAKPMVEIHEILRHPVTKKDKEDTAHILFIAAKKNKQFLVELIHEFPDLIWLRNDDGQTIFHIAIAQRQHRVYRFLKNIGSIKGFITPIIDKEGNNILHMVGTIPEGTGYKNSGITPLEILSEYIWYKDVERTLPPYYRKMKNNAGYTPEEEFTKGHMEAVSATTKCVYETISQSMVVAVLICTIGFSIVYSIPGGFDQSGFPVFRENKTFIWFILVEAISFLLAGVSTLTFINVILTRHDHPKEILLVRWLAGQEALYASIAATAIAFLSGVFLLYGDSILPFIISGIAIGLLAIYIKGVLLSFEGKALCDI
ncbi:uncharacterized protein LOC143584873 [Bidens hawaiensis]|uniref:uncharacterized protein LOC143584873 n=1 Tax=Bidens hawaiensis TaxID=980011 RepID=UPI00404AB9DF